jgi:hypothetical protein
VRATVGVVRQLSAQVREFQDRRQDSIFARKRLLERRTRIEEPLRDLRFTVENSSAAERLAAERKEIDTRSAELTTEISRLAAETEGEDEELLRQEIGAPPVGASPDTSEVAAHEAACRKRRTRARKAR